MPLVGSKLKQKMKGTIHDGLKRVFPQVAATEGYQPVSDEMWTKIADAVSDIANDIVDAIQQDAEVVPGIPVVGVGGGIPGPVSGSTVAPGKIQ